MKRQAKHLLTSAVLGAALLPSLVQAAAAPQAGLHADFGPCNHDYPPDELAARHEGSVELKFYVSSDGHASQFQVLHSSGYPGLDKAAIKNLSGCFFVPPQNKGKEPGGWGSEWYLWKLPTGGQQNG